MEKVLNYRRLGGAFPLLVLVLLIATLARTWSSGPSIIDKEERFLESSVTSEQVNEMEKLWPAPLDYRPEERPGKRFVRELATIEDPGLRADLRRCSTKVQKVPLIWGGEQGEKSVTFWRVARNLKGVSIMFASEEQKNSLVTRKNAPLRGVIARWVIVPDGVSDVSSNNLWTYSLENAWLQAQAIE